jgi:GrpB-like predicted nucleotidyltransferase (UPF0157 family)
MTDALEVVRYDPDWPPRFAAERTLAFRDCLREHIEAAAEYARARGHPRASG